MLLFRSTNIIIFNYKNNNPVAFFTNLKKPEHFNKYHV